MAKVRYTTQLKKEDLEHVLRFGKYKGYKIKDVPRYYLLFLIKVEGFKFPSETKPKVSKKPSDRCIMTYTDPPSDFNLRSDITYLCPECERIISRTQTCVYC